MPFTWKRKTRRDHFTILGIVRVNTTRRTAWFDRWDSATIPWFSERRVIWERSK